MKKIGILLISLSLLIMMCGCDAKIADNNVDYSGQTLKGQIDAIDKTTVNLTLGKLKENTDGGFNQGGTDGVGTPMDQGERPQMPEGEFSFGDGELPEDTEPFNGEERPELPEGMEPFNGEERPEMPEDKEDRPEPPEGVFPEQMGPGEMTPSYTFTPGSKTVRIDISGASIILTDGSQGSLDNLKAGDIVEVKVGKNNQVETVTVYDATINS